MLSLKTGKCLAIGRPLNKSQLKLHKDIRIPEGAVVIEISEHQLKQFLREDIGPMVVNEIVDLVFKVE